MKKIVALCIVLAILAAGCATLVLSPEERELVKQFNSIDHLEADDINFIKGLGLNPNDLSNRDKAFVMREAEVVARSYAF
ncbi:MAG: hypothetical protein A3H67_01340 [Candidatus Buchananbacteria bacterium RIFCSPLOWO2_02_FULL_46_11b]|uniref:Uncharacterized protein n=1 Tax=Candidatus Buchananbacteria bacterium RIFCSPLOWO2_02_FULL_46_11b TaxID=1797548 RepID=A0A1G1Z0Z2_9BACT|nr:MAG: hypothetical protein A3H67_01340 [Candidatus Buchananbacteria bacterium RIFCSPLOWO2_02_FULL_46_11b]